MASLKNIMNTEDEPVDPRSGGRSTALTSRPSSVHSYATSLNHQTPSSSHNNPPDPSGSSKSSSVIDHSSPTATEPTMHHRRRSNMSVDSNEMPYGPAQHASSSTTPMRPFTAGANSEPHVKLTPVTRKISKAKKGVPVHNCDQCPKTFSRAEHLRRHQLTHSPPDLHCPIPNCKKAFHRKDLLERHVQKHGQDGPDDRETKPSSSSNTPSLPSAHNSGHKQSQGSSSTRTLVSAPGSSNMPEPWSPLAPAANPSRGYNSPHMSVPENYSQSNTYMLDPTLPASGAFVPNYIEQPRSMPDMPMLNPIPGSVTPELWPDSSTSTSTFSTPPDNARRPRFAVPATNGPWMTTTTTYQTTSNDMLSTSIDHAVYPVSYPCNSTPPQVYQPVFDNMDLSIPAAYSDGTTFSTVDQVPTSTVRSVSPSLAVTQSETLVAIPTLPTSGRAFDLAGCSAGPSGENGLLSNEDLMPLSLPTAASEAIPRYLEVYWDKVHPKNPIIHRHTFQNVPKEETEHLQVLQCAMAALATQFIPNAEDRMKGAQLHAYAWQQSKVFTHIEKWSMPVQQTIALCEYYARFRGRKPHSHQPSARFISLYHRVVSDQHNSTSRSSREEHQAWKAWIAIESQRRLLAACFLLDVHSSWYHEHQYVPIAGLDYSSPSTLPIPLTATTANAWEAQDAQSWSNLRTRKAPKTVSNTKLGALSASDIASGPAFDAAVLLAVYSLYLPRRQNPAQVGSIEDAAKLQPDIFHISRMFPDSAIASTYLALHHTPLYYLLSVSGKSWVFNKKVTNLDAFTEHQKLLATWRSSSTASIATVFAARALKLFLGLQTSPSQGQSKKVEICLTERMSLSDISDYWGIYICTLICWAFGLTGKQDTSNIVTAQEATKGWILRVACQEPSEIQAEREQDGAQGVVGLVRGMLANDCLGGGNILFADALNVLRRLEDETTGNC